MSRWAEAVAMHAISRQHKWTFDCIDCRDLTVLHQRLKAAREALPDHNAKVAEADEVHKDEPMPRNPHEGDYYRGLRDGLTFIIEDADDQDRSEAVRDDEPVRLPSPAYIRGVVWTALREQKVGIKAERWVLSELDEVLAALPDEPVRLPSVEALAKALIDSGVGMHMDGDSWSESIARDSAERILAAL